MATEPKADFQKFLPDLAKEARTQFPQPWFRMSAMTAMSQLCRDGVNQDEMRGAQRFLATLVNIGEPPEPEMAKFPVKQLEHS